MTNQTTLIIKVDKDLKKDFQTAVKKRNRGMSMVIRDFMLEYIKSEDDKSKYPKTSH